MAVVASTSKLASEPVHNKGPSAEMRRFSAGMRVVTALLCTVLLVVNEHYIGPWALSVLLVYCLWSAWLLWTEINGRGVTGLSSYWIDVGWACLTMKLSTTGTMMLAVTLVHPVVLASIGYGVAQGVVLAVFAAIGLLLDGDSVLMRGLSLGWFEGLPTVLVLVAVPAAALLARPMSLLRHRLALIGDLEAQLDPRRGLDPICAELVERLRAGTEADVVMLVLPSSTGAPAMLASRDDGTFRAKPEAHLQLEAMLAQTPSCPVSHVRRRWFDLRRSTRLHGKTAMPATAPNSLGQLALTLNVRSLHVVPLTRYERRHGHFVVGYSSTRGAAYDVSALTSAAPELVRIVEQAALVDQLQEESAGHERARIGRDLHDTAIQPYLGLKYAVECVALRIPRDNPARAEVDALAELVNGEVAALRDLISGLRIGEGIGDNTLVPAVRRQVRRFSLLFGIDVEIDSPETLPTTRAMASSLFHMVNEALNNIRKHTDARHVWIKLSVEGSTIRLVVRDDSGSVRGAPSDTFRPISLSERVAELGGTLRISHVDGVNTELVVEIGM
jgi:signal transduction histidine kinase